MGMAFLDKEIDPECLNALSSWPSVSEPAEIRSVWGCMQLPLGGRKGFFSLLCVLSESDVCWPEK